MDETKVQHEQSEESVATTTRSRGVDADPADRPGVPMEAEPRAAPGAHWTSPSRQEGAGAHLHRAGLDRPTPIVGTAQPPHGVSGALRKAAYQIPEHYARHWMLLLLADRIDVMEDRLGGLMEQPLRRAGLDSQADTVAANPLATVAGVFVGAWVLKRILT